jgi:hypothetical protein
MFHSLEPLTIVKKQLKKMDKDLSKKYTFNPNKVHIYFPVKRGPK